MVDGNAPKKNNNLLDSQKSYKTDLVNGNKTTFKSGPFNQFSMPKEHQYVYTGEQQWQKKYKNTKIV